MPELPEVETTRRGIAPLVETQTIDHITVRQRNLRWPIPALLKKHLPGEKILSVTRRAKYLLLNTSAGTVLVHLGMSGSLSVVPLSLSFHTHDRFEMALSNGQGLRLHDPRRFGAVLWAGSDPLEHPLLASLGPEPLEPEFTEDHLYLRSRGRKRAVRDYLLDGGIVAGIGNIYANEALFRAGIRPTRAAGDVSRARYRILTESIRATLQEAIAAGGSSIKDFRNAQGRPGYFQQSLMVYGRKDQPCLQCGRVIRAQKQGNRTVFFCTRCQL
ncbi:MAG: bifunctional DNA-formamidopyrimidine glycosylase/DNA-(apurinic or apyrimidinic site) lyase [Gammaproteobacteria bacterium]|nr:bifunctional DNA-formamidopyrimidine glycosylase/DNA-(apurinic or apyrimidinic site) lyase [Gammaproteobacteria bacterium]